MGEPELQPVATELAQSVRPVDLLGVLVDASPGGALVIAPGGTIARVNRALERQFRYEPGELTGQPVELLLNSRETLHAAEWVDYLTRPPADGRNRARELLGRRKDGSQSPLELAVAPLHTPDGTFVLGCVVDVSEHQRREEELRRAVYERVEFERLVTNVSASLVSVKGEQVDEIISSALRRIVEALGVDRCSMFQVQESTGDLVATHTFSVLGRAADTGDRVGQGHVSVDVREDPERGMCGVQRPEGSTEPD